MAMEDVGTTCVSMSIISPIIGLDFGFAIWCGVSSRCGAYTELVKNAPKPLTPLNKWKVPKKRRKQQTTRKHNREGTVREGSGAFTHPSQFIHSSGTSWQIDVLHFVSIDVFKFGATCPWFLDEREITLRKLSKNNNFLVDGGTARLSYTVLVATHAAALSH